MKTRNKILTVLFILSVIGLNLLFKGKNHSKIADQTELTNQEFKAGHKIDEFTPFVKPKASKIEIAKEKQAIKSKIAQFRKKLNTNSPALIPTRAHEFHNEKAETLTTDKKAKKDSKDEAPKTEEEIAKAEKEAKEQAKLKEMMNEHCGDIKENKEKDLCFQAVANYAAEKKALEKRKKAQKKIDQENADLNEPQTTGEDADVEGETSENTDETPQPVVAPTPPSTDDSTTTDGTTDNQNKVISLSQWRSLLESSISINNFLQIHCGSSDSGTETADETTASEDSSVDNLKSKALALHFATNKSGCEQLSEANFLTLIKEYYLNSNESELEQIGMQSLNKRASLQRFEAAVEFLSKDQMASNSDQKAQINTEFRNAYLRNDRLEVLNHILGNLAVPVKEEDPSTNTPWNSEEPLFVAMELIKELANSIRSQVNSVDTQNQTELNNLLQLESSLISIQNELRSISEDNIVLQATIDHAKSIDAVVSGLIEQMKTIKPSTTETTTTNNSSFTRR